MPLRVLLAACYAHLGRLDEARNIIARLRATTPVVIPDASFLRHRELFPLGSAAGDGRSGMSRTRRPASMPDRMRADPRAGRTIAGVERYCQRSGIDDSAAGKERTKRRPEQSIRFRAFNLPRLNGGK